MKKIIFLLGNGGEVEKPVPLGFRGIKNTLAAGRALTKRYLPGHIFVNHLML
jgi:hypothetical protein